MKVIFLILPICLFAIPAHAQMCPCSFGGSEKAVPLKFEIGINLGGFKESDYPFFTNRPYIIKPTYLNGLVVKYHQKKISLRLGSDYYEDYYTYYWKSGQNFEDYTSKEKLWRNSFGIEKRMLGKKLKLSHLVDGIIDIGKSFNRYEYYNNLGPVPVANPYYYGTTTNRAFNIGIRTGLLLSYRPIERFSINAETSITFMRFLRKEIGGKYSYDNHYFIYSPLRLISINYHLNISKQF